MTPNENVPTYNLKVVVQETGLKPDTLRAWERRYNLPQPERTAGGHRLYSQRDIDTLKWLVTRQKEGLSISRAVDLWHQLVSENQDPLQAFGESTSTVASTSTPMAGQALSDLRHSWITATLDFDEQRAEYILSQAFALYSPEIVCLELLTQGMAQIGTKWYEGEVTVQQEHFASALAIRRLEALLAAAPAPTRRERLLVACPPQEEHIFGPLATTLFLRRQGWDVIYLGANVPLQQIEATVASTRPSLTILSAQLLTTAAHLLDMAQLLRQEGIPLAYGGRIFNVAPGLRQRIPGHFLGERLDHVSATVGHLIALNTATPSVEPVSDSYQQALAVYRERRAFVEADIWQALQEKNISRDNLAIVNFNLAQYITAALKLGDMEFLSEDMTWLDGLLINHRLTPPFLRQYLHVYRQVATTHLDNRAEPIIKGLVNLAANL